MTTKFQEMVLSHLVKRKAMSQPQLSYFVDNMLRRYKHLVEIYDYEKDVLEYLKKELDLPYHYSKYLPCDFIVDTYNFHISTTPVAIYYTPSQLRCRTA